VVGGVVFAGSEAGDSEAEGGGVGRHTRVRVVLAREDCRRGWLVQKSIASCDL